MSTPRGNIDFTELVDYAPPSALGEPNASHAGNEAMEKEDSIYLAARRGDLRAVALYAGAMEDIDALCEFDRTALYWAALCGHESVVRFLLARGARDKDGSALIAATSGKAVRAGEDDRDLTFDPDAAVYTDNVARSVKAQATDGSDAVARRIRVLLSSPPCERESHCAVCFDDYDDALRRRRAMIVPCAHEACAECLERLVTTSEPCMLCRHRIDAVVLV